ncbi:MAG: hypothetical protein NT080_04075 [Spirochaetes bacterium]|nr:hypothetical protein [Spirochaetota bacterium]
MRMKALRPAALAALILAFVPAFAAAEELYSDSGFYIDMPEGFQFTGGDGKNNFSFTDPNEVIKFQVILYDGARYASAAAGMAEIARKLGAEADSEEFTYQRRKAVLADLSFDLGGSAEEGYALFVDGLQKNPEGAPERDFLLLAYVPASEFEEYQDFILSCIDAFSIDAEARLYPGPVSQFDTPWDPARRKPTFLDFGGVQLSVPYDPAEAEASQFLVEREFRVLTAYAGAEDLAALAWSRFFRMVYRDSFHRLDYLALEVARASMTKTPAGSMPSPVDRARSVLSWTQGFTYARDPEGSDFVNPLSTAFERRGDCDSRSLLMAILLKHDGVDAIVMVSEAYAHAMAAIDAEGAGARFPFAGRQWLVAETTAKVDIGQIAQSVSDPKGWLGIALPD